MPSGRNSPSYWRILTRFEADKIAPWTGLRNAIIVVISITAAALFDNTSGGLVMAIGALNTAYSDRRDPYRFRVRRMSWAALLCGFAVFTGALVSSNHAAAIVLSGSVAFAVGLAMALGTAAAEVSVVTLVTFLVFSAEVMTPARAALSGVLALCGGLLRMALASAFWTVHPYREEQQALSDLFRELADAAAAPMPAAEAPPASAQATRAAQLLEPLGRNTSIDAERLIALFGQAERIRLTLLTLARLRWRMARTKGADPAAIDSVFSLASGVLRNSNQDFEPFQSLSDELRHRAEAAQPDESKALLIDARHHLDALTGQLRAVVDLAAHSTSAGLSSFERAETMRPWRLRLTGVVDTVRANLHWRSAIFRHAVRLAVCVTVGIAVGRAFDLHRSYWIPMTVAIVLRPDFSSTFSRGFLRMAGTLAGLAIATLLFHWATPGLPYLIAWIGVFAFLLRCFGPANYALFATAISALIVFLFAATGIAPQAVVAARAANTFGGGLIALTAYAAWPTWERTQIRELLAGLLDTYRRYFQLVRDAYQEPSIPLSAELDQARLNARMARSNVEASLARLRAEPGTDSLPAAVSSLLANSHRLIHAVMSLEAGLATSPVVPARAEFRTFANQVDTTLYFLAAALRGSAVSPGDLPDLREAYQALVQAGNSRVERHALVDTEADRITNSLNTLAEAILPPAGAPVPVIRSVP